MTEPKTARGKTGDGADWHIHYTVQGSGPALILLHGGGPGANGMSNYSRNVGPLSAHFTTYVIDFPGWGQSSKNLSSFGVSSFGAPGPFANGGRSVKAFMDAVGIAKRTWSATPSAARLPSTWPWNAPRGSTGL